MPLQPKRVKYRKQQRGSRKGFAKGGSTVQFGEYGLQALGRGWVTATQIEAARVAITRHMKRRGKVWIRIFPDKPYTKKPAETRQGKGKGAPGGWVAVVKPGRILFELKVWLNLLRVRRCAWHRQSWRSGHGLSCGMKYNYGSVSRL